MVIHGVTAATPDVLPYRVLPLLIPISVPILIHKAFGFIDTGRGCSHKIELDRLGYIRVQGVIPVPHEILGESGQKTLIKILNVTELLLKVMPVQIGTEWDLSWKKVKVEIANQA